MSFWKRQKPSPAAPPQPVTTAPPPVAAPSPPELDQLAKLLPERAANGRFFWQDYVDRIMHSFDGLPAPDGGASFVRECLAAGCKAVPAIGRRDVWERRAPPVSDRKGRAVFEVRIRLGLFFAASLRYVVHGACRLRVKVRRRRVAPAARIRTDLPGVPGGKRQEARHHLAEGRAEIRTSLPAGVFPVPVAGSDVAELRPGARRVRPRAAPSPRRPVQRAAVGWRTGRRASTLPACSWRPWCRPPATSACGSTRGAAVTCSSPRPSGSSPIRLAWATWPRWIRRRRQGPRHDFVRDQIVEALRSGGYLLGAGHAGGKGNTIQKCEVDSVDWVTPLSLNGLLVRADRLPGRFKVPLFDGTVTLEESGGGNASGNQTE